MNIFELFLTPLLYLIKKKHFQFNVQTGEQSRISSNNTNDTATAATNEYTFCRI